MKSRCLTVMLLCAVCHAAIPGADNPKAYTEHQYRQQLLEFNLRMTVEAYKQVGKRDPKWDQPAIALLEGMAKRLSNSQADVIYLMPDMPNAEDMEKLARQAIDAGCDDPLVLDMYSVLMADQHRLEEMTPILRKAADQLNSSHYSIFRATASKRRVLRYMNAATERELYRKIEQEAYDGDLATARFTEYPGIDRRIIYSFLIRDHQGWPVERQKSFCAELKAAGGDPWLTNMLTGAYHVDAAWAARGNQVAAAVGQDAFKKMAMDLAEARKCLTEAYRLQPTYPEAAERMLMVVMGDPQGSQESLREWFDRAVKGQLDFAPAYDGYLYAIRPRWGGSHEQMYAFASECRDTGRYDTRVPFYFVKTLAQIHDDMAGDWTFSKQPGVMESLADVLSHYADSATLDRDREIYCSRLVSHAWQTGRYDIGKTALDKSKGKYQQIGFYMSHTIPQRTVSGTYAMTGSEAEKVKLAEADVAAGKLDGGIKTYQALAEQTRPEDPSSVWMHGRSQELNWLQEFNKGGWVDLTPQTDLAGWYPIYGQFTVDGKSITVTCEKDAPEMICGAQFGRRYEMRGQIEVLPTGGNISPLAEGGVLFGWISPERYCAITVRPGSHQFLMHFDNLKAFPLKQEAKPVATFLIQMWDGYQKTSLDGVANSFPYRYLYEFGERIDGRIGIGSCFATPGAKFKVSDLQIHKLENKPQP